MMCPFGALPLDGLPIRQARETEREWNKPPTTCSAADSGPTSILKDIRKRDVENTGLTTAHFAEHRPYDMKTPPGREHMREVPQLTAQGAGGAVDSATEDVHGRRAFLWHGSPFFVALIQGKPKGKHPCFGVDEREAKRVNTHV